MRPGHGGAPPHGAVARPSLPASSDPERSYFRLLPLSFFDLRRKSAEWARL